MTSRRRLERAIAALALLAWGAGPEAGRAQTAGASPRIACAVPDSVSTTLARIARRVAGEAGIAALHIETGARVSVNGDRGFPMASVSKVPMALAFLHEVDADRVRLADTLIVPPTDFRAGNSPLASWSGGRPVRVTVDSLFRLMIRVSDNTATDVILRMAGGPGVVDRHVRELGVEGVSVDRTEARTFADVAGIPDTVPASALYRYSFFRMRDRLPADVRRAARLRYGEDGRDNATPDGMADLLREVYRGAGLSSDSRALLLEAMAASRSGPRRLRGLLPRGTPVAHKTGTMAGAVNDVGIVTLPGGAGHLAVAVFVNSLHHTTWRRERTIAQASRAVFDYFAAAGASLMAACTAIQPYATTPAGS